MMMGSQNYFHGSLNRWNWTSKRSHGWEHRIWFIDFDYDDDNSQINTDNAIILQRAAFTLVDWMKKKTNKNQNNETKNA